MGQVLIFNFYCLVGQVTFFFLLGKWAMLIFPRLLCKWASRSKRARFSFLAQTESTVRILVQTHVRRYACVRTHNFVRTHMRTVVRTSVPMRKHDVQTKANARVIRTSVRPCIRFFVKEESLAKL